MRVVLIKGISEYGVLRLCVDQLGQAFERAGWQVTVIAPTDAQTLADGLTLASAEPADLVFTFGILGDATHMGRSIGEVFSAPHVIQYVDYPLSHTAALDNTPANVALLFVDRTHPVAVASVYGAGRFASVGFSPHAALGEAIPVGPDPESFRRDRPIPLLFCGTFFESGARAWRDFPSPAREIYDAAYDLVSSEDWVPALSAVDEALRALGLNPADPALASVRKGATLIHEHVRAERRLALLRATARLGIPLHVCGRGYDRWLGELPNVTYLGPLDVTESLAAMGQARMVLNANANFGAGSHERVLSAMNAGAAVASDTSSFYQSSFRPGQEILLYRWTQLDEDLQRVARIAEDPEAVFALAAAGQARVRKEHLWDHRLPAILAAADSVRRPTRRPEAALAVRLQTL